MKNFVLYWNSCSEDFVSSRLFYTKIAALKILQNRKTSLVESYNEQEARNFTKIVLYRRFFQYNFLKFLEQLFCRILVSGCFFSLRSIYRTYMISHDILWRRGVVVITTEQIHSTKPEFRFCAGSNSARGVLEIGDGEVLWEWSEIKRMELRLNAFCRSTIPQKQFIIIIIIIIIIISFSIISFT